MLNRIRQLPPVFWIGLLPVVVLLWIWADSTNSRTIWEYRRADETSLRAILDGGELMVERKEIVEADPEHAPQGGLILHRLVREDLMARGIDVDSFEFLVKRKTGWIGSWERRGAAGGIYPSADELEPEKERSIKIIQKPMSSSGDVQSRWDAPNHQDAIRKYFKLQERRWMLELRWLLELYVPLWILIAWCQARWRWRKREAMMDAANALI